MVQRDADSFAYRRVRINNDDMLTKQFFDAQVYPSASLINIAHAWIAAVGPVDVMSVDAVRLQEAFKQAFELSTGLSAQGASTSTHRTTKRQHTSSLPQTQPEPRTGPAPRRTPDPATDEQLRSILDA